MNIASPLNRIIQWLHERPLLNALIVIAYAVFLIFMHGHLVLVSVWIMNQLTFEVYNKSIEVVYLVFLALLSGFLWRQFRLHGQNLNLKLSYLFLTITFIIIHSRFMFDSNIEVIHSFEFTFLAFLIFPFTKRFGAAIFFTLPFMLIDEWYQFIILYPGLDYLDLNDIMMDTYGCGLAMTVLFIAGVKPQNHIAPLNKRPEFITWAALIVVVLLAAQLCLIASYTFDRCGNTLLVINEGNVVEPFWRQHPSFKTVYHVMKPLEALIAIASVHLFYLGLDSLRKHTS
jgi:hypothetical protein